jgi:hypothetical protein
MFEAGSQDPKKTLGPLPVAQELMVSYLRPGNGLLASRRAFVGAFQAMCVVAQTIAGSVAKLNRIPEVFRRASCGATFPRRRFRVK